MDDLIYRWKEGEPVQIAGGAKELPGGFKLDGFGDQNCDVITATGPLSFLSLNIYICKEQSSNYPGILCPFPRENF